jgi:hypothetical protein
MAHGELYQKEFGWDATFEALVAKIVAEYAANHDPVRAAVAEQVGSHLFAPLTDQEQATLRDLLTRFISA